MTDSGTQFLEINSENSSVRRIAYDVRQGQADKPGVFWLSGFKSSMRSQKVTELAEWAEKTDTSLCRMDYSGHGESGGDFEDGTISHWLEEALAVFEQFTSGPQVLVGSSMGGWISLLLMKALQEKRELEKRIAGCVMIAPAWDMTETLMWDRFPSSVRKEIEENGKFMRPSAYEDGPYAITKELIEDGRKHLLRDSAVRFGRPIRILHGVQDPDVPYEHSLKLIEHLDDEDIALTLIKDGEHRLSRPQDLARLISEIELIICAAPK